MEIVEEYLGEYFNQGNATRDFYDAGHYLAEQARVDDAGDAPADGFD
ncbi:MAG: hypothetical protein ACOYNL_06175 [Rickettsiales bacterium]